MLSPPYQGLAHWYRHNPGKWLLSHEKRQLQKILKKAPGQHLLQIGGTPELMGGAKRPLCFYYFLDAVPTPFPLAIQSYLDELPLLPRSLNSIIVSHALEFCEHPMLLLQNCYEALTPGGTLILFCFNPWSLWGLAKCVEKRQMPPWTGRFFSLGSLKSRLEMLDFEIKKAKTFCFHRARFKMPSTNWSNFIESIGQFLMASAGAVSLIVATKKMSVPLMERSKEWSIKRAVSSSMIEPTTRSEKVEKSR